MKSKKAQTLNEVIIHILLVGFIFVLFFGVSSLNVNSRGVKQQVLEKQIVLLIDSGFPEMKLVISKVNINGIIEKMELKNNKVFVYIDGLKYSEGQSYFSEYKITLEEDKDNYYILIRERENE
jgi:hypothetical protein